MASEDFHPDPYPLEFLFGRIKSPFERFLQRTTAGGIVLVGTTVLALAAASVSGDEVFHHFWSRELAIAFGDGPALSLSLHHWVNDGLMALFFLLVGLELKREVLVGELSSPRDAVLPVVAAVGGMVVPALIYAAFNRGLPTASGWGVPMATDIAFAVGILVLLAWRIPKNLIVFLTALAIADDLGAVLVIALFYSTGIDLHALGVSGAILVLLAGFNRAGIRHPLPYAIAGLLLWGAVLASGLHATLAGILLALMIPARPSHAPVAYEHRVEELLAAFREHRLDERTPGDPLGNHRMAAIAEEMEALAAQVQSPLQRVEHGLTPWVTFVVIPIFAIANAAIDLTGIRLGETLSAPVTQGIVLGLVLGKFTGIALFSWIAVRLGWGRLPAGVEWRHLLGAAWLAGIGFTMSLFIGQLAFTDPATVEQAKLGILLASALSATIGLTWLFLAAGSQKAP